MRITFILNKNTSNLSFIEILLILKTHLNLTFCAVKANESVISN